MRAAAFAEATRLDRDIGESGKGLGISTYHSGKFYLLGQNTEGGWLVDERFFRKAMGIAAPDKDTLLLATLFPIIRFKNVLGADQQINNLYDSCYVPRSFSSPGSWTRTMWAS